jgi:hypothetical protein
MFPHYFVVVLVMQWMLFLLQVVSSSSAQHTTCSFATMRVQGVGSSGLAQATSQACDPSETRTLPLV